MEYVNMQTYMLLYNWAGDWVSSERFTFHAKDPKDARDKVRGWAHYHHFCYDDVDFRPATSDEIAKTNWLHNEWV
jgi:hypothetical protein